MYTDGIFDRNLDPVVLCAFATLRENRETTDFTDHHG